MLLTLDQLATVGLAGVDLERDDVPLRDAGQPFLSSNVKSQDGGGRGDTNLCLIEELDGDSDRGSHIGGLANDSSAGE